MDKYPIRVKFIFLPVKDENVKNDYKSFFNKISDDTFQVIQYSDFIPKVNWYVELFEFIPTQIINEANLKYRTTNKILIESTYFPDGKINKIIMGKEKITIVVEVHPKPIFPDDDLDLA